MNDIKVIWGKLIPTIEEGIRTSEDGRFVLTQMQLERRFGVSEADWDAILKINKKEERFLIDLEWELDWTFRLPPR